MSAISFANLSLRSLSYYGTGGSCLGIFAPRSMEELAEGLRWFADRQAPVFVLGAGSNSLLSDDPYDGYVITMHDFSQIRRLTENSIVCAAGARNEQVVRFALEQRLSGLEWMWGLPGQIGGTTRMNARCYGGQISQVVSTVTSLCPQGRSHRHINQGRNVFKGYKNTLFMTNQEILCHITLSLQLRSSHPEIQHQMQQRMEACRGDRERKGQYLYPSCGCVFKNNHAPQVGVPSGMLLERAGAKSLQENKAMVSPYHANFIYNKGATADDILCLSYAMREKVYEVFGVWMEYEMELLGCFSAAMTALIVESRPQDVSVPRQKRLREVQRDFRQILDRKRNVDNRE